MIKTTIEWYTLDEKLPFDGEWFGDEKYKELLGVIDLSANDITFKTMEMFRYLDGMFGIYVDGEFIDFTKDILYWAYVPKIGE